jgi:hypothetical protein
MSFNAWPELNPKTDNVSLDFGTRLSIEAQNACMIFKNKSEAASNDGCTVSWNIAIQD